MLKSSTIAVCVLALSSNLALAQAYPEQQTPPVKPDMASGPAGRQTMSGPSGYGLLGQSQASAPMDNPRGVALTDEYGNQYNSRGDRIGRGKPPAKIR